MSFSDAMGILGSGMRGQAQRLTHISENIANADTPGFRRKTIGFRAAYEDGRATGAIEATDVRLDRREGRLIHDPAHPLADANGLYRGSNVELVIELADARQAQRSYEANLKMFEQVRRMSSAVTDILKR
jgi:flagellar basal-body rod protein FlgC